MNAEVNENKFKDIELNQREIKLDFEEDNEMIN